MNHILLVTLSLLSQIICKNSIQSSSKTVSHALSSAACPTAFEKARPSLIINDSPYPIEDLSIQLNIPQNISIISSECVESNLFIANNRNLSFRGDSLLRFEMGQESNHGSVSMSLRSIDNDYVLSLYSLKTNLGLFVSQQSLENCYDHYYTYALKSKIINYDEYYLLSHNHFKESSYFFYEDDSSITKHDPDQFNHKTTQISGNVTWGSDRYGSSALRGNKVVIFAKNIDTDSEVELGTTKTDSLGNYSFYLSNQQQQVIENGALIIVSVFSEIDYVSIVPGIGNDRECYRISSDALEISVGSKNKINFFINVDSSTIGHAFCVSQAIYWGERYVRTMTGYGDYYPNDCLNVFYPGILNSFHHDSAFSSPLSINFISIGEYQYNSWDVTLHEFGHYLQKQYDCADSNFVYASHSFSENFISRFSKQTATKLAWQEAWPTVFAILVTKYFTDEENGTNELETIPGLGLGNELDEQYSYLKDGLPEISGTNIENRTSTNINAGETCEGNIAEFLYDLYDSSDFEYFDNVSVGHKILWDLVTKSNAYNFSEFIQYVYSTNLFSDNELGDLLSFYSFSVDNITFEREEEKPPKLMWDPSNDWESIDDERMSMVVSNIHKLKFFDGNKNYICELQSNLNCHYAEIPKNVWKRICNSQGDGFYVQIFAYSVAPSHLSSDEIAGFIETGPYLTGLFRFPKPNKSQNVLFLYPTNYLMNDTPNPEETSLSLNAGSSQINLSYNNAYFVDENRINMHVDSEENESLICYTLEEGFYKFGVSIFDINSEQNIDLTSLEIFCFDGKTYSKKASINLSSLSNSNGETTYFEYDFNEKIYEIDLVLRSNNQMLNSFEISIGNVLFDMYPTASYNPDFSNNTDVNNPNLPPYLFPIYVNEGNWGNVPSFGGKH